MGKYEFAEVAVPCTRTLLRGTNNLAERGLGTALEPRYIRDNVGAELPPLYL